MTLTEMIIERSTARWYDLNRAILIDYLLQKQSVITLDDPDGLHAEAELLIGVDDKWNPTKDQTTK